MKRTALILGIMLLFASCGKKVVSDVPNIIFETDMGNDIDDAMALDLIYKYMDEGKANLLAIMLNKEGTAPAEFLDIMGTFYGYPEVPVGIIKGGADCETDAVNYAKAVVNMKAEDGSHLFARSHGDYADYPEAHILYRKILSEMPDNSVTIVSVGFSTNLKRLLETGADEYSDLSGKELVARKVRLLCTMAGNMIDRNHSEYNVFKDIPAARTVFSQWTTPVVTSPFELGFAIEYPGSSIEQDFGWAEHHPMVEAYKAYLPMPYNRPTWDLTAVLYALDNRPEFFTESGKGTIDVSEDGITVFTPGEGLHSYIQADSTQRANIKSHFIKTLTRPVKE